MSLNITTMDILKYSKNNIYNKPLTVGLDYSIEDSSNETSLSVFKMVLNRDYNGLIKYSNSNYVQTNILRQTPLMLSSKIGDIRSVSILINEAGCIDDNGNTAIDYSNDDEVRRLLMMYEPYKVNTNTITTPRNLLRVSL